MLLLQSNTGFKYINLSLNILKAIFCIKNVVNIGLFCKTIAAITRNYLSQELFFAPDWGLQYSFNILSFFLSFFFTLINKTIF